MIKNIDNLVSLSIFTNNLPDVLLNPQNTMTKITKENLEEKLKVLENKYKCYFEEINNKLYLWIFSKSYFESELSLIIIIFNQKLYLFTD